jgi:hypothetical protein
MFWADAIEEIYIKNASDIFQQNSFSRRYEIGLRAATLILITFFFFRLGRRRYDNPSIIKALNTCLAIIKEEKERILESRDEPTYTVSINRKSQAITRRR